MAEGNALPRAIERHKTGDFASAERLYRQALASGVGEADACEGLGLVLASTGRTAEALEFLVRAVGLRPDIAAFHNNLGQVRELLGNSKEAEASCRQALALQPHLPEAHFNLGNALKSQGRHAEAIPAYRRALELVPGYAKAAYNLANALREYGLVKDAVAAYRTALTSRPNWPEAWLNLGNSHVELHEFDEAIQCYHEAAALDPGGEDYDASLAAAYSSQGDCEQAAIHLRRASERKSDGWLGELRLQALAEPVAASASSIDAYREALAATLEKLLTTATPLDLARLHQSGAEPPMALAYQGRDDRPLKEAYARLFEASLPSAPVRCRPHGVPHVGVIVTHGHEGVFLKCLGGLVERLPTPQLRVTLACSRAGANVLGRCLGNSGLTYLILPDRVDEAGETLRAAGLHLAHYWEVGTDSSNYFLPFMRPAPLQSATWGWPVTSGNRAIDYFVSSDLLEPEGAEKHYTEKLIRLPSLPTYYRRPELPTPPRSRADFGLPPGPLYLCAQNLRKYHPDFDAALTGILEADPRGHIGIISDQRPLVTERLRRRLAAVGPSVFSRILWLPRLEQPEYLNVLALADVALDTFHYGGGANTVYDAMAIGTPLVTWPGPFHRGRFCAAVLGQLGLTDGVAESVADYVNRAVLLAARCRAEPELRRAIVARGQPLFESTAAVRELREFMLEAISA